MPTIKITTANVNKPLGAGSGVFVRMAISTFAHLNTETIANTAPPIDKMIAATLKATGTETLFFKAAAPKPVATSANAVRSPASAVRSFASDTRASGSSPTR